MIYTIPVQTLSGEPTDLQAYQDKVMLIVKTASRCGLTPQYTGLQSLYEQYKEQGLVVLGFPCNQFMQQEPGSAEEIQQFCSLQYNVTFPMFAKIEVNGDNTHPLYVALKSAAPFEGDNADIEWNFAKFLVHRNGNRIQRFSPKVAPDELQAHIADALAQN